MDRITFLPPHSKSTQIRQVWAHNLHDEFNIIRSLILHYPYVSMDTEFPGVIHSDSTPHYLRSPADQYHLIKKNVNDLELIQLGLTLSDHNGNLPEVEREGIYCIWEFNFSDFDPLRDRHNPDSIALLERQGIDFSLNRLYGIHSSDFVREILHSGILYNPSVTWVTFHSAYDFAYLIKILRRAVYGICVLPETLNNFLIILEQVFQNIYDIKHVMQFCGGLRGGLENVAKTLQVEREVGLCHQSGSDSLLTWRAFLKIRDTFFDEDELKMYCGIVYGLMNF